MMIGSSNGGLIQRAHYPVPMERLPWIVFVRDREKLEHSCPELRIVRYQPIMPLRYWLSGGLRRWNLLPWFLDDASRAIDRGLLLLAPDFGSFVVIELLRARPPA
jgi:hypothetical protein